MKTHATYIPHTILNSCQVGNLVIKTRAYAEGIHERAKTLSDTAYEQRNLRVKKIPQS